MITNYQQKTFYTDHPFSELGDKPNKEARIREVIPLNYDGDKYCDVLVNGIKSNIKAGYIYEKHGRISKVPCFNPVKYFGV